MRATRSMMMATRASRFFRFATPRVSSFIIIPGNRSGARRNPEARLPEHVTASRPGLGSRERATCRHERERELGSSRALSLSLSLSLLARLILLHTRIVSTSGETRGRRDRALASGRGTRFSEHPLNRATHSSCFGGEEETFPSEILNQRRRSRARLPRWCACIRSTCPGASSL